MGSSDNTLDQGCYETWDIPQNSTVVATTDAASFDGNFYPHAGSVVYIHEGGSLQFKANSFTAENAIMPGYLLLKTGASLYGNGNVVHAVYVAAERTFSAQAQYTLMSMPFPYDYANALTTATDGNGNITEKKIAIPTGKTYNGEKRSA